MRFIKLGLISIAVFGLLLLAISALLPSSINISRAIDVAVPTPKVQQQVANLNNWKNWYAGYSDSSPAGNVSGGTGNTIMIGNTVVSINQVKPLQVKAAWKNSSATLLGEFNFTETNNVTTVQWLVVQKVQWYPWQKLSLLISNQSIGAVMEKSLDNLKQYLEH